MPHLYYKQLGNHGRLGNSLFQIASTIGVARANNMQPLFPANWKYRSVFNVPDEMFGDCPIEQTYKESHFHFVAPDFDTTKNTELTGYFQSERYFHAVSDEIKSYLTPKGALPGSDDAVSIHHRRGDYVNNPNYQQLGMNYYISAYDTFFKGKEIKAFSDDHKYIDLHYKGNSFKTAPTNEITDFVSMINCKNHICSNSTFSWWAAYLSGSDRVIRPFKYFDGPLLRNNESDFWPLGWITWANHFKPSIRDTTFIIPFSYDHQDRYDNITTVINFLVNHFDCEIHVGEINSEKMHKPGHNYTLYKMPTFHRTFVLNDLTKQANTPFVFNYDADVITSPWQIYKAVEALRSGADIVYPFLDDFACVPRTDLPPFIRTLDPGVFAGTKYKYIGTYKSVGGAVGYNKESFLKAGGENEGFISYGHEDQERYHRFKLLGLDVRQIPGSIFHMEHYRGENSCERHPNSRNNISIWEAEKKMTAEQMREYVNSELWGTNQIPSEYIAGVVKVTPSMLKSIKR